MQLPKFNDPELLKQAFTHRSAINEGLGKANNERLEFLGDAVLELVVSDYLFKNYPEKPEGLLTNMRTALVRTETLAKIAIDLGISGMIVISKGEERTGGRQNNSLLANTMEAVIGAIYLDQGLTGASDFLDEILLKEAGKYIDEGMGLDGKSKFQEIVQAKGLSTPVYKIIGIDGPDHDRVFTSLATVDGKIEGKGKGHSKQEAEQAAAKNAIETWYNSDNGKN